MFSDLTFFSFVELTDPTMHRPYNEWHQLDHLAENRALPGVAWGDRWRVPNPPANSGTDAAPEFAGVDYVAMYWFRPPYERSVADWTKLGEDSFQWGRGPLLPGVRRPLTAFFVPVQGYVAPEALVNPDVLPFRPNRGLHVTLSAFEDEHGAEAHEQFRWYDRVRVPDLLGVDGVAGAWTFALKEVQHHPTLRIGDSSHRPPGSLRIRLLYLDGPVDEVTAGVAEAEQTYDRAGRGAPFPAAEQVLFSAPVATIVPWQDW